MPARRRRTLLPPPVEDPTEDLRNILNAMDPDELDAWYQGATREDQEHIDRILAEEVAAGWRANPATMAHHFLPDEYKLWPYFVLLGQTFADGIYGRRPRQAITIPSQMGKTSIYGRWGLLWALDLNPRLRIMYVTYDVDKAVKEGGETRDLAERFQDDLRFTLRADAQAKGLWRTDQGGYCYFTAVGGQITGWPADVVVNDDLVKGWEAAHSPTIRNMTWNVYVTQIRMRIQKPDDPIMFVGTRWHEDDPIGRALKIEDPVDKFHLLRLPAIAEAPSAEFPAEDPLGRKPGEIIEPDRFPEIEVRARARSLGSYLAAALEQQRPSPEEGNDLKRAWFKLEATMPHRADQWAGTWDMKLKEKEQGDFVVGLTLSRIGGDFWLHSMLRGQWNQSTTRAAIALQRVREQRITVQYVENSGYGPEVIEQLRRANPTYVVDDDIRGALQMTVEEAAHVQAVLRRGMSGLVPVPPRGDKRVRARAVSPIAEAGNMHVDAALPELGVFLNEMAQFPNGTHDDIVDAWSQGLSKMSRAGTTLTAPPQDVRIQRPSVAPVPNVRAAVAIRAPWQR